MLQESPTPQPSVACETQPGSVEPRLTSTYFVIPNDRHSAFVGKCGQITEATRFEHGWPQFDSKLPVARPAMFRFLRATYPATIAGRYKLCLDMANRKPATIAMIQGVPAAYIEHNMLSEGDPAEGLFTTPLNLAYRRNQKTCLDAPRDFLTIDWDRLEPDGFDARTDSDEIADRFRNLLDALDLSDLIAADAILMASSSYGLRHPNRLSVHSHHLLDRPRTLREQKLYVESINRKVGFDLVDVRIYGPEHLVYPTPPRLHKVVRRNGQDVAEPITLPAWRVHLLHVGHETLTIPDDLCRPQRRSVPTKRLVDVSEGPHVGKGPKHFFQQMKDGYVNAPYSRGVMSYCAVTPMHMWLEKDCLALAMSVAESKGLDVNQNTDRARQFTIAWLETDFDRLYDKVLPGVSVPLPPPEPAITVTEARQELREDVPTVIADGQQFNAWPREDQNSTPAVADDDIRRPCRGWKDRGRSCRFFARGAATDCDSISLPNEASEPGE